MSLVATCEGIEEEVDALDAGLKRVVGGSERRVDALLPRQCGVCGVDGQFQRVHPCVTLGFQLPGNALTTILVIVSHV